MLSYSTYAGTFAALGSFAFGFDTGIVTTSIAHASFKKAMGNPNAAMTGAIVSTYIAGEAVGAVIQMICADKWGRKRFMQAMAVLVTIGSILQTAAQGYSMFLAGRVIAGVGIGGLAGTAPVYNAELAPPNRRGFVGGLVGLMIVIGSCSANWLGWACGYAPEGQFQWRWNILHGRDAEALAAFTVIREDLSPDELEFEFSAMKEQIMYEKVSAPKSFAETWRRYKKRVLVSVLAQSMTSATGINVINYYQSTLYTSLGITGHTILLLSAIYGTVGLLANMISIRVVDRVGRVRMLIVGTAGVSIVLIYTALLSHFYTTSTNKVGKGFAILGIYLFTTFYYGCINSTTWLYGSEVLPMAIRSKVMGLASCSHFVINVALTQAGPSAFANIKANFYYVFVGVTTFSCICIILYFPETKNKSLEAIAASFGDEVVAEVAEVETGKEKLGGVVEHIE
ncbi:hypothetical protein RQP46_002845 [Phenoliferia psychrophenolica]